MLVFPCYVINLFSSSQSGSGLVVIEGDSVFNTLHVDIKDPGIITDPRFWTGLPADRNILY